MNFTIVWNWFQISNVIFIFATTEYGYKVVHINFFETSHAKGSQDAAGGFIKRQADIAVLRGITIIQNTKDLFSFCNNDNKFSDILGTFEIILIICIIWGFFYGSNQSLLTSMLCM
jgi:hypothetical protein